MTLPKNKNVTINGVTLYFINDDSLCTALANINAVIVYATTEAPNTPVFYQRYCDYIDSLSIQKLDLVEAVRPYDISKALYPKAFAYYNRNNRSITNENT